MDGEYVFGPVLSGRLGRSLGLDLLGGRICSMDCVYCEVGETRELTRNRRETVPAAAILDELSAWARAGHAAPDMVTLGGLGEPCLNTALGEVIAGAREVLPGVPVAVLTNATLLDDPGVRAELAGADVVLPSLDSLVEREFRRINRPAGGVTAAGVADALLEFRRGFGGRIFLEVLLAEGYNDSAENLELLAAYVAELAPDRVDVVTMTRPGTLDAAHAVDADVLARWRERLGADAPPAPSAAEGPAAASRPRHQRAEVLQRAVEASIRRRPQTKGQLARAMDAEEAEVSRALDALAAAGRARATRAEGETWWNAR